MIRKAKYTPELKRFHRLMEDDYSLDAYWHQINRRAEAARSTVEALMYQLRMHGLRAIGAASCQARLTELSEAQLRDVITRLICMRAHYPAVTNDLLSALVELLPNER
jgi:hypothetical protein